MWLPEYPISSNLAVAIVHRQPMDYCEGMLAKRFGLCQDRLNHCISELIANSGIIYPINVLDLHLCFANSLLIDKIPQDGGLDLEL